MLIETPAPRDAEAAGAAWSRCASEIDERVTASARCATTSRPSCPRRNSTSWSSTASQIRRYRPGETLFNEGDPSDGLYLDPPRLGDGLAHASAGARSVLSYVAAGSYVGEMALLLRRAALGHGDAPRCRPRRSCSMPRPFKPTCSARNPTCASEIEDAATSTRMQASTSADGRPQPRPGNLICLPDAAGRRRGDRRAADRRDAVHALRQLREGLRRHPRRHLAPGPRGRARPTPTSMCRPRAGTARIRIA